MATEASIAMKKILILLAAVPLVALAANESGVKRFDRANEGAYFGDRERINPTSRELRELSKEQGMPVFKSSKNFPVLPEGISPERDDAAGNPNSPQERPPVVIAKSYRTMGDAAQAGVDPLQLIKPMTSTATVVQEEGKYDLYYYAGGILGFVILAGLGFLFSLRTPNLREE
jgi:hypothetical protein